MQKLDPKRDDSPSLIGALFAIAIEVAIIAGLWMTQ